MMDSIDQLSESERTLGEGGREKETCLFFKFLFCKTDLSPSPLSVEIDNEAPTLFPCWIGPKLVFSILAGIIR